MSNLPIGMSAAGKTREETPEQSSAVREALRKPKDTPQSGGAGSHTGYEQMTTRATYASYLEEDTRHTQRVALSDAFGMILNLNDQLWRADESPLCKVFQDVVDHPAFQRKLDKYLQYKEKRDERKRYAPFVDLCNFIFGQLEKKESAKSVRATHPPTLPDPIRFCRHDPILVLGSDAGRKPDGLGIRLASAKQRNLKDSDLLENPTHAFHWMEALLFLEFKRLEVAEAKGEVEVDVDVKAEVEVVSDGIPLLPRKYSGIKRSSDQSGSNRSGKKQKVQEAPLRLFDDDCFSAQPDLQCASYALEMLSHGGLRTHAIGLLISNEEITLKYYDHSIAIDADQFSFVKQPKRFIAMLYAMRHLNDAQWGFDPVLGNPIHLSDTSKRPALRTDNKRRSNTFQNIQLDLPGKKTLILQNEIFNQHSIIGRGTRVVSARIKEDKPQDLGKSPQGAEPRTTRSMRSRNSSSALRNNRAEDLERCTEVAIKFSYVPVGRTSEVKIVGDLRKLADQTPEDRVMLDHLPLILGGQDYPAQGAQRMLKDYFDDLDESKQQGHEHPTSLPTYEERVLRITVQELLKPIKTLRDGQPRSERILAKIFQDVYKCYKWVHEKGRILHRDISINNLMYREKDDQISGVLIDYDLAASTDRKLEDGPTSKQRTGTKPYMARDLLAPEPEVHTFRHDLESYFYCLLWMIKPNVTYAMRGGGFIDLHPLYEWNFLNPLHLHDAKVTLIRSRDPRPAFLAFGTLTNVAGFLMETLEDFSLGSQTTPYRSGQGYYVRKRKEQQPELLSFAEFEFPLLEEGLVPLVAGLQNAPFDSLLAKQFNAI